MDHKLTETQLKSVKLDARGRGTIGSDYANQELTILVGDQLDISALQPYHARHKLNIPDSEVERLFAERKIAFHWMDDPFVCKEAYADCPGKSTDDLNAFHRVTSEGGLVTAQYHAFTTDFWVEGYVEAGTPIEPELFTRENGDTGYIKTVQLMNPVEIPIAQYPDLEENKPQYGTLRRWNKTPELPRTVYQERIQ